jgi:hypothetical protein
MAGPKKLNWLSTRAGNFTHHQQGKKRSCHETLGTKDCPWRARRRRSAVPGRSFQARFRWGLHGGHLLPGRSRLFCARRGCLAEVSRHARNLTDTRRARPDTVPALGMAQTATPYGSTRVIVDGIDMTGMGVPSDAIGGSSSSTTSSRSCVTMCWHFQEGQIYCQGCAIDEGDGGCTVWEFCSDTQGSGSLK